MLNTLKPINKKKFERHKKRKLLFEPEPIKENKTVKNIRKENFDIDKILRDLKPFLFEPDREDCYEPVWINNLSHNNDIEYESNGDKDKTLSTEEYLDEIKPYLSNVINDHKTQGEWKIQLAIAVNFLSSKDTSKMRTMHSKSDNIEIMIGNETDKIIEELFKSLL